MNYQETTTESLAGIQSHIIIENDDGSFKSFPADNSNPEFLSFLQTLEKENDPYFLAWVEAGNNPEDFWTEAEVDNGY